MKKSPQSNTILNYFGPTPKKKKHIDDEVEKVKTPLKTVNNENLTMKTSTPNSLSNAETTPTAFKGNKFKFTTSTPNDQNSKTTSQIPKTSSATFKLFDIVWAKLDGYVLIFFL